MRGLIGAWAVGMGIIIWRQVHVSHHLPVPGTLLGVTGLFATLGVLGDVFPASESVIVMAAWGLDVAGFLNVLPKGLGGQIEQAQQAQNPLGGGQQPAAATGG